MTARPQVPIRRASERHLQPPTRLLAGRPMAVGAGVNADIDMAKDCYKQAAHAGLVRPQVNLGYVALRCQQYNKAVKHFRVRLEAPILPSSMVWVLAQKAPGTARQARMSRGQGTALPGVQPGS